MKKENELLDYLLSDDVNIKHIENLFKEGIDPNYVEDEECLFVECMWNCQQSKVDLYALFKLFIDYGLDVDRFATDILEHLIYIDRTKTDVISIAKLILKSVKNKIPVDSIIEGVDTEESFYTICYEHKPIQANRLMVLRKVLEAYNNDEAYEDIFYYNKAIGQKLISAYIVGEFEVNDKVCASWKTGSKVKTVLQLENDILVIENNNDIYIDNNLDVRELSEFSNQIAKEFKDSTVKKITFDRYHIQIDPKGFLSGFTTSIIFSNRRRLRYKNGLDYESVWIDWAKRE